MAGNHAFSRLTEGFPPDRLARVEVLKGELRAAMPLHELRKARAMTQKSVGDALKVKQPAVAKLERRTDIYVSSLRSYIEAMGGQLNIVARFPQGSVVITNFSMPVRMGSRLTLHRRRSLSRLDLRPAPPPSCAGIRRRPTAPGRFGTPPTSRPRHTGAARKRVVRPERGAGPASGIVTWRAKTAQLASWSRARLAVPKREETG